MRKKTLLSTFALLVLFALGVLQTSVSAQAPTCELNGTVWEPLGAYGEMRLNQSGSQVTGDYDWDGGTITGTLSGLLLKGEWAEEPHRSARDAGGLEFVFARDCNSFTGKWRYGSDGAWHEDWSGIRAGTKAGEPTEIAATYGLPDVPFEEGYERIENPTLEDLVDQYYATEPAGELLNPHGGDVFLHTPEFGWQGPLTGNTIPLYHGDVVHTKDKSVEIRFSRPGWEDQRARLLPRSTLQMPTRDEFRKTVRYKLAAWLVNGALQVGRDVRSEVRSWVPNTSTFSVRTGTTGCGPRGTDFIIEFDQEAQIATYTVSEGIVDVWFEDDPSTMREVQAGESVRVDGDRIDDNQFEWDALAEKYGLSDVLEPVTDAPGGRIDGDTKDAGEEPAAADDIVDEGESGVNVGLLASGAAAVFAAVTAAAVMLARRRRQATSDL